ncbi:putative lipoprotein [Corallococcus coralloides]|uniref:Putative lipoprotein n=1 Tax=Corallococcus coralloides TaxID=184914 RepID=A0A410RUH5_CORCK|nr:putative lipoprotein [Corallococcus coralloides]
MKRSASLLLLGLAAAGCARAFVAGAAPVEDDRTIVFPQFFEQASIQVGTAEQPVVLDGAALRALTLAADDHLPPDRSETPCAERRTSHVFRVIQREDIVFVRIDVDPSACGGIRPGLDSGVRYAISRDGRILRRILDGMEPYVPSADGGVMEKAAPGVSPSFDPERPRPLPFMDSARDAGALRDAGAPDAQVP